MTDKKVKKLKRKVWLISVSVFLIYIALVIANPSVWTGLILIIIPAGTLTIGIPVFDILKHRNNKRKIKNKTQEYIRNVINNQTSKNDVISNSYNKEVMIQDNMNVNNYFDKPKVKTKGTIN